ATPLTYTLSLHDALPIYCPQPLMSCQSEQKELRARSVSLSNGAPLDDVRIARAGAHSELIEASLVEVAGYPPSVVVLVQLHVDGDRKSTRLNSSHRTISY